MAEREKDKQGGEKKENVLEETGKGTKETKGRRKGETEEKTTIVLCTASC